MYKIKIIPLAQKDYAKLKGKISGQIKQKILTLKKDPRPRSCRKLTNENGYRIRIRDYRLLYRIDDKKREIFVYRIKQRSEAYK